MTSLFAESSAPPATHAPPAEATSHPPATQEAVKTSPLAAEPHPAAFHAEPVPGKAPEPARDLREELSARVENFRRRRARLRGGFDPGTTLDLEFGTDDGEETDSGVGAQVIEFPRAQEGLDVMVGSASGSDREMPVLDSHPLERPGGGLGILHPAAVEAGELTLEHGAREPEPVEIILESSRPSAPAAASAAVPMVLPQAPLGRRFLAGVVDALVLVLSVALFAVIFWRAGGHVSPQPANLVILGFIAVFFILVYFGLFTALTSTTPGLLWMGLEVRNLDGTFPTPRESFWRAFGYVVSIAALMLGFIWALVDSDGLTWHDRMSGTFLAVAESAVESRTSKAEG